MIGDKLVIKPEHRRAAAEIADWLAPTLDEASGVHALTIAGESGSGKSELAQALADHLEDRGIRATILQQDDYFVYPPKTNHRARLTDITWVGPGEVRLDLLDRHLAAALAGEREVEKPLVHYEQDRIDLERRSLEGVRVAIAEGTYTSLLANAQTRVFIDRTYRETKKDRLERAREAHDDFLERVLEIEHRIIAGHKDRANLLVDGDFRVHPGA